MKILLTSRPFFPSIGGLNGIAYLSAKEFQRRGHEVRLITQTPGRFPGEEEIAIIRRPGFRDMLGHYEWCDVVFQNHVSLRYAVPLLFVKRPYVVSMSGWVDAKAGRSSGKPGLGGVVLSLLLSTVLRCATRNIAACAAVASANRVAARVIPNPFDAGQFRKENKGSRSRDILFIGRLGSDKGVDDLIKAVAIVSRSGINLSLAVAGEGAEEPALRQLAQSCGIGEKVKFLGPKRGEELPKLMNAHQMLVVPSKWNEPIGIVALEAIACGCVVIGSEGGGLQVTIGPCGLTYPNGDYESLARRIAQVLAMDGKLECFTSHAAAHLERYRPERVCAEYLEEIERAYEEASPAKKSV